MRAALMFFELEPEWMPPDDGLKALVEEAVNDPRPMLTTEEVHESILELHKHHVAEIATKSGG